MSRYRIERPGALDLEFDGQLLSNVSSREGTALRWTEVRIYRTSTGRYVTEVVGRSVADGEKDRLDVKIVDNPQELPKALERQPGGYLTMIALDALDDAADHDPAIRPVVTERI